MASKSFFAALSGGNDIVFVRKSLVDLTGDIVTAAVLSQIAYWFDTGLDGKRRVQVFKHGRYWLAKQREDWWEECRVSAKQFDRAAKRLKELGLIETKSMRFNGMRTLHIWFNEDLAEKLYNAQGGRPKLPDGEDRNYPKGETEIDERGRPLTETTPEPSTKTHKKKEPSEIEKPKPTTTPEQDIAAIAERLFADRSKFASKTRKMADAQIKAHCQRAAEYLYDHTHNKYQRPEFAIEAYKSEPNKAARWANQSWRFTEPKQEQATYQPPAKKSAGRLKVVRETKFD